jgi:hypothetical protein
MQPKNITYSHNLLENKLIILFDAQDFIESIVILIARFVTIESSMNSD